MNKGLLLLLALFGASGFAVNFTRVAYMPIGEEYSGNICFFDSDHDSVVDFHMNVYRPHDPFIVYWTRQGWNRYVPVDSIPRVRQWAWAAWAVGDFDKDSLTDIAVQIECSLAVFESRTRDSFPKQAVWKWPYEFGGGGCIETHVQDLDQDGWNELIYNEGRILFVLENYGNNLYRLVARESLCTWAANSDIAFGDFDLDGRQELVKPCALPSVVVYECVGDNQYRQTWLDSTSYINSFDVVATDDADGDGKAEFWVGWMKYVGGWVFGIRAYEAVGDDSYQRIFLDTTYVWGVGGAHVSAAGDLDSDGRPEVVWCVSNNWFVYKAVGNNTFQRIFGAYPEPRGNHHDHTKVFVYDLNGNGYPEIIETGLLEYDTLTETTIWEIEGVRLHRPNGGEVLTPGSQSPITWEKFTPPGADSFSLFVSYNNALTFKTITTGLTANDTLFLWSVPDTLADSCKLMIWAYGPPRAGQQVPRGTAWDFSDSTFAIRQTGVGEAVSNEQRAMGLRILQNPTTAKQGIKIRWTWDEGRNGTGKAASHSPNARLQIYDVSGRVIHSFALSSSPSALCSMALPAGVYFVRLGTGDKALTQKAVILR